jgi:hypothetical protein
MKHKNVLITEEDRERGAVRKIAYRGYTAIITANYGYIVDDKHGVTVADDREGYCDEDTCIECVRETIDEIVDRPKEALKRLKECSNAKLLDIFYSYATSAPAWVNEVMEMIPYGKKRKWLIEKITDMLSDSELAEEMGL